MQRGTPEQRIEELEKRLQLVTEFAIATLFRLEALSDRLGEASEFSDPRSAEIVNHIRHVADEARVAGFTDDIF